MGKMLRIAGMGLSGLMVNRGRSALSMLGIVIGVFAVILLTSLGNGVQEQITGKLTGVGSNVLLISPGNSEAQGDGPFISRMSRPGTPDLFESCGMLQPFAHLARRSVSPNIGLL